MKRLNSKFFESDKWFKMIESTEGSLHKRAHTSLSCKY